MVIGVGGEGRELILLLTVHYILLTIMVFVIFWLELTEYLVIFLAIISFIFNSNISSNSLFFVLIILSLILNNINRFREENRNKVRIGVALKVQLKKFSDELAEVNEKIDLYIASQKKNISPPKLANMPKSDDKVIASLQDDVLSITKSITNIVDYIKENKFELRLKNLEQLYQNEQISFKSTTSNSSRIKLPSVIPPSSPLDFDLTPPPRIAWKCIHILNAHSQSVTAMDITGDDRYLFTTSWDQDLKVWNLKTGDEIDCIQASDQAILSVCVAKNNYDYCGIATGSLDQKVKIWSLIPNKDNRRQLHLEHILTHHTGSVHCLAVASSQKILLSGSSDQTLKQWDLETGDLISSCFDDTGAINACRVAAPEGSILGEKEGYIAGGGGDGVITLWQLGGEEKLGLLVGNVYSIDAIALSPLVGMIAAGCADGSIKIWRLPVENLTVFLEIEPIVVLKGHHGQVMDLCFSPDGQLLYSGGVDGFIKIWHPNTEKELGHLKISEDNRVVSLSLSHDGKILVAGGVDGTVKIWQQT